MKSNHSFLICKLPNSNSFLYTKNEPLSKKNSASFTYFDESNSISFFQDEWKFVDENFIRNCAILLEENQSSEDISKEKYIQLLEQTKQKIVENGWKKVVISRKKTIPTNLSPTEHFLKLCEKFPQAFSYFLYENPYNCWIGSTPEVLCEVSGTELKTMALAGTLPNQNSYSWTEKEHTEHRLVIEDICEKIKPFCSQISVGETEDWNLQQLKHLKTDITATLFAEMSSSHIIKCLHPTSAVCGMPLLETQKYILENESHQREFYTGYIEVNLESKNYAFVNLRCAKFYNNSMEIFVGGGITADSNSEKEWEETELKSLSILEL